MKQLRYYILFILFSCAIGASAQLVQFQNFTMADGLSGSKVYSIGQDQHGFLWFGTNHGLNIYDGIQFRNFFSNPQDETSIPGNDITKLVFQGDSVWIGTRTGLGLINVISKKCTQINLGENHDVRTLFLERNKQVLWVGTNTGLIKYNIGSGTSQVFNTGNSNISHNIIRSLYKDLEGNLWIGTFNKLNKLPLNSTIFEVVDLKQNYRSEIKNNLVLSILPNAVENDSVLWIGTETGLVHLNRYTYKKMYFREENSELTNSAVKTLLKTSSDKLWIGTDFGLGEMNPTFNIQIHQHDPFKNNSLINSIVWDIFEDKSGAVCFGTDNGISILSNSSKRFQFYPMVFNQGNSILGYEITDIIEDRENSLWLTSQLGLVQYNSENQLKQSLNTEKLISRKLSLSGAKKILEDSKGRFWLATNGGLVVWNPVSKQLKKYTADLGEGNDLKSNYITNLFELPDGSILVNTYKGLHRVVENTQGIEFEFLGRKDPISMFALQHFWGIQESKLLKINSKTFEKKEEVDFAATGVELTHGAILFLGENTVWIGAENGLIKYNLNTKEYDLFKVKSDKIFPLISLLADDGGNIWASSNSAILKFSLETKNFAIYPSGKEIPISRFIPGCCLKRKNGDLIFGGQDGFIQFSPEDITKSDFISPIRFTSLQISNRNIKPGDKINGKVVLKNEMAFTKNITLDYASNSFFIEFSSLHFGNRSGIRYAYILEGEDADWKYLNGDVGQASYSTLRSGKYLLRVRGTNNDGVWSTHEALLHIWVKPPLWASPVFIIIYFILLVLIAIAIIYYYTNRAKMRNQIEMVRFEKQQNENMAKERQQFFTNISHEFRTPLSLILGPIEKLAKNSSIDQTGKSFIQLIDKNARRLLWLNNQFLDFRKLENKSLSLNVSEFDMVEFARNIYSLFTDKAERKGIHYSFTSEFEKLEVVMDLRKIETILFNLLSNAFKFSSDNGEILVGVHSCDFNSGKGLSISVKDSGRGISESDQQKIFERFYQAKDAQKMQRGSGIGLALVNEYVHLHQGEIVLKSEPGKGADFQIRLPLAHGSISETLVVSSLQSSQPLLKQGKKEKSEAKVVSSVSGNPSLVLVEDEKEIADFICMSLKERYNVHVVTNGKMALQFISKHLPDLVISDVKMPEMDGIEFTKKFKRNPKTSHIPLILLSGKSEIEDQLEGLKSGADAYITKPFDIEMLEVRIENFLKGRIQLSEYIKRDKIANPKEIQLASHDEKLLKRVVDCIEKYISDPGLNIDKVCSETGMSHSVLYRKIKSLTGQTINEFIRTVRVRRAEQLLRTKKFSVSEVMYETGFSNHSYFSKCFRKLYQMSPKEYIEQV